MTIHGWIVFGILLVVLLGVLIVIADGIASLARNEKLVWIISAIIALAIAAGLYGGLKWYYTNTASGQRAIVDQKSEFNQGLERTIKVYTADGDIIAEYTGVIDIEGNNGGYVLFDYDGKRYTYYNCFVESIAEIDGKE